MTVVCTYTSLYFVYPVRRSASGLSPISINQSNFNVTCTRAASLKQAYETFYKYKREKFSNYMHTTRNLGEMKFIYKKKYGNGMEYVKIKGKVVNSKQLTVEVNQK